VTGRRPGQCVADPANAALFPLTKACTLATAPSFACGGGGATANQSAGGWFTCGALGGYQVLNPIVPSSVPPAGTPATPKFVWPVLNPPDYQPDKGTFPGADYYELNLHESWGFQTLANLGAFPNPPAAYPKQSERSGSRSFRPRATATPAGRPRRGARAAAPPPRSPAGGGGGRGASTTGSGAGATGDAPGGRRLTSRVPPAASGTAAAVGGGAGSAAAGAPSRVAR